MRWPNGKQVLLPKVCPYCGVTYGPRSWEKPSDWSSRIHCSRLCALKARTTPISETLSKRGRRDPVSGCLVWTGDIDKKGYGRLGSVTTREVLVHRVSWIEHNGPIPAGLHVLHHCDNRPCFEPAHLYLGTNDDNVRDRLERGRSARLVGERNPRAKLTSADVAAIRLDDRRQAEIAADYRVYQSTISAIKRGATWTPI